MWILRPGFDVRKEFNRHQALRVGEKALLYRVQKRLKCWYTVNTVLWHLARLIRIQIIENKCVYYLLFKKWTLIDNNELEIILWTWLLKDTYVSDNVETNQYIIQSWEYHRSRTQWRRVLDVKEEFIREENQVCIWPWLWLADNLWRS